MHAGQIIPIGSCCSYCLYVCIIYRYYGCFTAPKPSKAHQLGCFFSVTRGTGSFSILAIPFLDLIDKNPSHMGHQMRRSNTKTRHSLGDIMGYSILGGRDSGQPAPYAMARNHGHMLLCAHWHWQGPGDVVFWYTEWMILKPSFRTCLGFWCEHVDVFGRIWCNAVTVSKCFKYTGSSGI